MQRKPKPKQESRLREQEITEAILEYFAEHPNASDTLEGIAEWWIMRQQVRFEVEMLANVLRHLTGAGLLQKVGEGDQALYQLKAGKDAKKA
ncbi:MAG: hypothetical protein DKINENOH_02770 [bacterium]|nr:hypothetical protein [bacterium]MCK6561698.1 hypothetical protein [bacterium]NUM68597.1 hypothetical protein [candidate division KSB1 bacterium]